MVWRHWSTWRRWRRRRGDDCRAEADAADRSGEGRSADDKKFQEIGGPALDATSPADADVFETIAAREALGRRSCRGRDFLATNCRRRRAAIDYIHRRTR